MGYEYIDKTRESDEYSLPDVEVFHADQKTCIEDVFGESFTTEGFYYAFGTPGCLWDSDPVGPFDSEAEALAAARESAGYCEHGKAEFMAPHGIERCPNPRGR